MGDYPGNPLAADADCPEPCPGLQQMARLLHLAEMAIGAVGVFSGFYLLSDDPKLALRIVTGSCVGLVGTLAFVRHVLLHRSDAARLGWHTDRPDWQFEVGFANLAFGSTALLVALRLPSFPAFFALLCAYPVYLGQAAVLHLHRYLTDERPSSARLWDSVLGTALFAAMLGILTVRALRG